MSANIWYEEVYKGLVKEVRDNVRFKNADDGSITALTEEAVKIRVPDEDFLSETFPCVSLYIRTTDFAKDRYAMLPQKVINRDVENSIITLQEHERPYNISLQIDFWARYQSDMDLMIRTWLRNHFRQFNLPVKDDGKNETTINCLQKGEIVKSDLIKDGKRLFHSIITYQIWVVIDDEIQYNRSMVGGFDVNV